MLTLAAHSTRNSISQNDFTMFSNFQSESYFLHLNQRDFKAIFVYKIILMNSFSGRMIIERAIFNGSFIKAQKASFASFFAVEAIHLVDKSAAIRLHVQAHRELAESEFVAQANRVVNMQRRHQRVELGAEAETNPNSYT